MIELLCENIGTIFLSAGNNVRIVLPGNLLWVHCGCLMGALCVIAGHWVGLSGQLDMRSLASTDDSTVV